MAEKTKLPEGTWSVSKEDKQKIVEMGRAVSEFVFDYINKNGFKTFHVKIAAGAFQYFMDVCGQKEKLIGEDLVICQAVTENYKLGEFIQEPYAEVDIPEPTKEERIAYLKKELEVLETAPEVKKDEDIENAMIAPSAPGQAAVDPTEDPQA
jgi:hypothetical protein